MMANILGCQEILRETRRTFFNKVASSWDSRFCNENLTRFLEKFVPTFELGRGEKILDVGTGTGVLIPHLVRATGSSGLVVAVDFAEKMVQVCNEKCSGSSNVMVGLQTVEKLGFLPESFDTVTCFGLFPHIENKEKALREINRVLKCGSKLVIAHALSSEEIKQHHQNGTSVVVHDVLPNKEKMRKLLRVSGFAVNYIKDELGCYICVASKISQ